MMDPRVQQMLAAGAAADELPRRFPANNYFEIAPTGERRTALAKLQATVQLPRGGSKKAEKEISGQKAAEVECRVAAKLQGRRELANVLSRVDTDRDGQVSHPQFRSALESLLVTISDEDFQALWGRFDALKRGVISIATITKRLSGTATGSQNVPRSVSAASAVSRPGTASQSRPGTASRATASRPGTACKRSDSAATRPNTANRSEVGRSVAPGVGRSAGLSDRFRRKLRKMQAQMLQKLDRIDQTRMGSVPLNRFLEVAEHFEMEITVPERQELLSSFGDATGCRVRYRDLFMQVST